MLKKQDEIQLNRESIDNKEISNPQKCRKRTFILLFGRNKEKNYINLKPRSGQLFETVNLRL